MPVNFRSKITDFASPNILKPFSLFLVDDSDNFTKVGNLESPLRPFSAIADSRVAKVITTFSIASHTLVNRSWCHRMRQKRGSKAASSFICLASSSNCRAAEQWNTTLVSFGSKSIL
eukprot:Skav224134  [mRNA]  locus=scaffold462:55342:58505:+ [translate_table: standard]